MSWLSKVVKSNLKGLQRNVLPVAAGLIPGVGGIAARALLPKPKPAAAFTPAISQGHPLQMPEIGNMLKGAINLSPAGIINRLTQGATSQGRGRVAMVDGQCPKGYHADKATRSFCVRNRRVNYANGQAARRAGRRLRGTVKMLRKSFSLVEAKAPKGKFIPRKK